MAVCLLELLLSKSSQQREAMIRNRRTCKSLIIAYLRTVLGTHAMKKDSPDPVPGTLIRLPAVRLPRTLASREQARHAAAGKGTRLGRAAAQG